MLYQVGHQVRIHDDPGEPNQWRMFGFFKEWEGVVTSVEGDEVTVKFEDNSIVSYSVMELADLCGLNKFAFVAVATNANTDIPEYLCKAFLADLPEEGRNVFLARHPESDIRYHAARWWLRRLSEREARKYGYEVRAGDFADLSYILPIDEAVGLDEATGLEAGLALARKHGFEEGYRSITKYAVAPTANLFIHERRQLGDAIIFIASLEGTYTVGLVYAPLWMMQKYSRGRQLPGY